MQQIIPVAKKPFKIRITIPGSKSMTNRALLLAALAKGDSTLSGILLSDDTRVLLNALKKLGIAIQVDEATCRCIVKGSGGQITPQEVALWCGDAGTVKRFLLAVCASFPGQYSFNGSEQLRQRPIALLLQALCAQGAAVTPPAAKHLPFTLTGTSGLRGGKIKINAAETGQFVSALLLAAPFAQTPLFIQAENLVSHSYVEMTRAMMAEFGVQVECPDPSCFSVLLPQHYQACDYTIEPDLSTASYFFAAAAVTGSEVTIQPMGVKTSKQGDAAFLHVLKNMGCDIIENSSGLTVKGPAELRGINVDMQNFSDTFMTLATLAPFAMTPTTITHIQHARHKESDRLAVTRKELQKLKIRVEEGANGLKIYPGIPQPATIDSHQDHRIAMAFSIIGLRIPGIIIDGADCVNKTCPEFFKLWQRLYL